MLVGLWPGTYRVCICDENYWFLNVCFYFGQRVLSASVNDLGIIVCPPAYLNPKYARIRIAIIIAVFFRFTFFLPFSTRVTKEYPHLRQNASCICSLVPHTGQNLCSPTSGFLSFLNILILSVLYLKGLGLNRFL